MFHPQHHPPEEWDARRPEIQKHYIDEDRTLQNVIDIMTQKGFMATTKMYKTRLKRWKIFKNNRAVDVAAILHSQSRRAAVGKESIAVRAASGRRIDTEAYLRRKGVSAVDLLPLVPADSLPGHLRCVTPPPGSPRRGRHRSPSPMADVVFHDIGSGDDGSLLGIKELVGRWILGECERLEDKMAMAMVVDSGIDCGMIDQDRPLSVYYESTASKVAAEYYDVVWLLQKFQNQQGWALAEGVFSKLHVMLDDNCEHLLYPILNLLMIILALPPDDKTEIHRTLWAYLSSQALIRLGTAEHPACRMLQQLADLFSRSSSSGSDDDDGWVSEKYGLLHSILSDAISLLASKMEKEDDDHHRQGQKETEEGGGVSQANRQIYYDLVSLWYAETLHSHRGGPQKKYGCNNYNPGPPQLLHQAEVQSLLEPCTSPSTDEEEDGYEHHQQQEQHSECAVADLGSIQSYLLLDLGWQTSWRDQAVYDSCAALLRTKEQSGSQADETEVNCLTAMALYHRARCSKGAPSPSQPPSPEQRSGRDERDYNVSTAALMTMERLDPEQHHELARRLLSEAVSLDWDLSGASIYNFEGLLLLQEWCAEAGDQHGFEIVRERSRECLEILFGEWGV